MCFIVFSSCIGSFQCFVCFVDLDEHGMVLFIISFIGMVLNSKFFEGFFNIFITGSVSKSQRLVVILHGRHG